LRPFLPGEEQALPHQIHKSFLVLFFKKEPLYLNLSFHDGTPGGYGSAVAS
jgi:hypothetical protein